MPSLFSARLLDELSLLNALLRSRGCDREDDFGQIKKHDCDRRTARCRSDRLQIANASVVQRVIRQYRLLAIAHNDGFGFANLDRTGFSSEPQDRVSLLFRRRRQFEQHGWRNSELDESLRCPTFDTSSATSMCCREPKCPG